MSGEILLECPACEGEGQLMARVQYADPRRGCDDQLRDCPICNGSGEVTSDEHRVYYQKLEASHG